MINELTTVYSIFRNFAAHPAAEFHFGFFHSASTKKIKIYYVHLSKNKSQKNDTPTNRRAVSRTTHASHSVVCQIGWKNFTHSIPFEPFIDFFTQMFAAIVGCCCCVACQCHFSMEFLLCNKTRKQNANCNKKIWN